MSELKEHLFCDCNEMFLENGSPLSNDIRPYYLKYDADNVITELKEEIEKQKQLRDMALSSVPNVLKVMKIIQHHKYKRCMAIAMWCEERYKYLTCLENWQLTDKEYQQVIGGYWDRWYERWLKIAKMFKEAK